ncbi:SCO7613 C-terminal domain-containing membrane protein [Nocardioides ultimimeridianus]
MNTTHAPYLPDTTPLPPRSGVSYASVPKILLGLGAFCLLAAAGIFLAVSWSTMGVGGRTAVLAALTVGALTATLALHRGGLRMAAEAISVVTLGFLTLDVYGAAATGLLGGLHGAGTTLLAGGLLAAASSAFALLGGAASRLVAPQVVSGVGIVLAYLGGTALGHGHPLLIGNLTVVGAAALAWTARRAGLPTQQWSCLVAAGPAWAGAAGTALVEALLSPTLHQLWVAGTGWSLLVSAATMLVPAAVLRNRSVLLAGASGTALLATATATIPVIGSSATTVVAVTIAVTAAWTAVLALVRSTLRVVAIAPAALGAVLLGGTVLVVVGYDLIRWGTTLIHVDPFGAAFLVRLEGPSTTVAAALVVPAVLVLAALLATALAGARRPDLSRLLRFALPGAGVASAIATASYDVPLAASVGVLALTAVGLGVAGALSGRSGAAYASAAFGILAAATVAAIPSAGLTAAAAGTAVIVAAWLAATAVAQPVRLIGEVAMVPAFAISVFSLLAERHITTVEAFTLPLAAALLVAGLLHLRRHPAAGTEVLLPALLLALVPTTLIVLGDPISLRALLLGAGCVVLVLAGGALRWSTPVLAGAATAAVLVLREIGPYATTVPQWVWIGLAGVVLTLAGITWERQMRDLRRAVTMIGRLR